MQLLTLSLIVNNIAKTSMLNPFMIKGNYLRNQRQVYSKHMRLERHATIRGMGHPGKIKH